jgi:hypothetical protein
MRLGDPRLCRGGSRSLTFSAVRFTQAVCAFADYSPTWRVPGFDFDQLRSGPFEGPATVKPLALLEDHYCET